MSLLVFAEIPVADDVINRSIINQVAQIEQAIFLDEAWSVQALTDLLANPNRHLLIATQDVTKIVMGYCLYQQLFEDAEIFKIGTAPYYQRQGVASQLLTAVCQRISSRQAQRLMLEVSVDNLPAIYLYQKHGFTKIGIRKNYYSHGDGRKTDAAILEKSLMALP